MAQEPRRYFASQAAVTKIILIQFVQIFTGSLLVYCSQWYKVSRSFRPIFLVLGIIILVLAVLNIILALWRKSQPIFVIHEDRLEVGKRVVAYQDIEFIERKTPRMALLHLGQDGSQGAVRAFVGNLLETEKEELLSALEERVKASKQKSA
jgi:hypothetical protein